MRGVSTYIRNYQQFKREYESSRIEFEDYSKFIRREFRLARNPNIDLTKYSSNWNRLEIDLAYCRGRLPNVKIDYPELFKNAGLVGNVDLVKQSPEDVPLLILDYKYRYVNRNKPWIAREMMDKVKTLVRYDRDRVILHDDHLNILLESYKNFSHIEIDEVIDLDPAHTMEPVLCKISYFDLQRIHNHNGNLFDTSRII